MEHDGSDTRPDSRQRTIAESDEIALDVSARAYRERCSLEEAWSRCLIDLAARYGRRSGDYRRYEAALEASKPGRLRGLLGVLGVCFVLVIGIGFCDSASSGKPATFRETSTWWYVACSHFLISSFIGVLFIRAVGWAYLFSLPVALTALCLAYDARWGSQPTLHSDTLLLLAEAGGGVVTWIAWRAFAAWRENAGGPNAPRGVFSLALPYLAWWNAVLGWSGFVVIASALILLALLVWWPSQTSARVRKVGVALGVVGLSTWLTWRYGRNWLVWTAICAVVFLPWFMWAVRDALRSAFPVARREDPVK